MGQCYTEITDSLREFIAAQQLFFVGTAAADGRVGVSPKGLDSLRVLSPNRVLWLNLTGSGNEAAAHVQACARMTLMFSSFGEKPMILRLYGDAEAIHQQDPRWPTLSAHFAALPGSRQIFDLAVDLAQTSCGFGVPRYDYLGERGALERWAERQGEDGIADYWRRKNQTSLDGKPSHIVEKNLGPT